MTRGTLSHTHSTLESSTQSSTDSTISISVWQSLRMIPLIFRRSFFHHCYHLHQRRRLNRTEPQYQHQNPKDTGKPTAPNLFHLGHILSRTTDTIAFCQKHRLLPTSASCPTCHTTLHRTYTVKRLGSQHHEVRFQCIKGQCKSRLN